MNIIFFTANLSPSKETESIYIDSIQSIYLNSYSKRIPLKKNWNQFILIYFYNVYKFLGQAHHHKEESESDYIDSVDLIY